MGLYKSQHKNKPISFGFSLHDKDLYAIKCERKKKIVFTFFLSAVGNAFAVLNDPGKRKKYDMFGPEEEQRRQSYRSGEYDYAHGFEGN